MGLDGPLPPPPGFDTGGVPGLNRLLWKFFVFKITSLSHCIAYTA